MAAVSLAVIGLFAVVVPSAGAVPFGVTGYFGNPDAVGASSGGLFGAGPQGVAINDATGDVYVVDSPNNRVQMFDSLGGFEWAVGLDVIQSGKPGNVAVSEQQTVTIGGGPTGGSFVLRWPAAANASDPIPFNATPAQVQAALEAPGKTLIGAGNVSVSVAPGGDAGGGVTPGGPWRVEFIGALADTDVAQMTSVATGLTPVGSPTKTAAVATTVVGAGAVEKCEVAEDCKAGLVTNPSATAFGQGGAFAAPAGIAINQTTGDFYVANATMRRVDQFDADGVFVRAWGADVVASGSGQADEEQVLIVNATGGQYRLDFAGQETVDLDWDEPAGDIETALNNLSTISTGGGSVAVTAGPTYPGNARSYLVEFNGGPLVNVNQPTLVRKAGTVPLSGGAKTVSAIPLNDGATGFEICETAADCKVGTAGPTNAPNVSWNGSVAFTNLIAGLAVAPAGAPNAGNVLVGSSAGVKEFAADGEFVRSFGYDATTAGPDNGGTTNEVQTVTVRATGGTFMLRLGNAANNTVALPVTATATQVEDALNATPPFGANGGWVTVTGGPGDATGSNPYVITFHGALQGRSQIPTMVAIGTGLSGGSPSSAVTVAKTTSGAPGFEVCKAASLEICLPEPASGNFGVGSGVGQFGTTALPSRVAIDTAGNIYTVESASPNFRVQKFTAAGSSLSPALFCPAVGSEALCGAGATDTPTDVAVDTKGDVNPSNDRLFVVKAYPAGAGTPAATGAERRVVELDTLGVPVETHLANSNINSVNGLAVKSGGQPGYLTSTTPKAGFYEIGIAVPPTAAIAETTGVTATCATFNGTVNPNGGGSLITTYRFEYSADGGSDWTLVPASPVNVGNGTDPVDVQQTRCGLEPNKPYQVRLIAIKGGNPVITTTNTGDFTTDQAPPSDVQTFPAYWDTGAGELVLRGSVNPNNTQTSYWFEYGIEPCSANACARVPVGQDASAGSGGLPVEVSQRLDGLEGDATYHYRLVADNGVGGPVAGEDLEFAVPAAVECDNEELREANGSTSLPDCRAIEWVSNGNSWGAGVFALGRVSVDGGRALFSANAVNDPDSFPGGAPPALYTAVREQGRWSVFSALPPGDRAWAGGTTPYSFWFAPSLTHALWPGVGFSDMVQGKLSWLIEGIDGSSVEAHEPMVPLTHVGPVPELPGWQVVDATPDLSTFLFYEQVGGGGRGLNRGQTYLADEPLLTTLTTNIYSITGAGTAGSRLDFVNRETNPSPGVSGAQIGGECGATGHAVSDDGETVFFSARPGSAPAGGVCVEAGNPLRLYKRVNGEVTTPIGSLGVPGGDDVYQGSSDDGSVVLLTSPRQLVASDTDSSVDLYLYDESPPGGGPELVQVSAGEEVLPDHPVAGSGAGVVSVLGIPRRAAVGFAGDGSRVYFTATGRLVEEAVQGEINLYVYQRDDGHSEGRIELVATLDSDGGRLATAPRGSGGDGRFLMFTTTTQLALDDTDSSSDVYRYDDQAGQVTCVSCMGNGAFDVLVIPTAAMTDDGSTIAFSTAEGLLASDANGASDAYVWRDGALALASVGSGPAGAKAAAVSPDGSNVFFVTRAGLYPADTNNAPDVYAAHVGGGFPLPVTKTVCGSGGECQGAGSGPPSSTSLDGSASTGNADTGGRVQLALAGLSASQRRKAARSGALSVRVRLDRPGIVRVAVRARVGRKTRQVGSASKRLSKPGAAVVRIELDQAARARLRKGRKLSLSVQARSEGARPRAIQVVLRRPGR